MVTRRRILAAVLASPAVIAGCKIRTINEFPSTPADVRAVNVILGSTAVDILEGQSVAFGALAFESASEYAEFDNSRKTFVLRFTGQTDDLASTEIALAGEQKYTLVAFGTTEEPRLLAAPDVTASNSGTVQVRLINAALGAPAYNLYITAPEVVIDENLSPNFFGIQGGSSTVSLRFDKGTYKFTVVETGTFGILYDSGPVDLSLSNSVDFLVYLVGSRGLPTGMLLDVDGALRRQLLPSSVTSLRLIHAAPQSGTIVAKFDGRQFTQELTYPAVTSYGLEVAGTHTVTVESTAAAGTPIASAQYDFKAAHDHSVVVVGLPGAVQLIVLADDNRLPPAGLARTRFANMTSDSTVYDVWIGETKQIAALAPRTASPYVFMQAGTYQITFRDPASGAIAATLADVEFDDGQISTVYVAGVAGNVSAFHSIER